MGGSDRQGQKLNQILQFNKSSELTILTTAMPGQKRML